MRKRKWEDDDWWVRICLEWEGEIDQGILGLDGEWMGAMAMRSRDGESEEVCRNSKIL